MAHATMLRPRGPCSALAAIALVALVLSLVNDAGAALTTAKCLAQKRKVWGTLRKCQANEDAKRFVAKPADLAKCTTKFQVALAKIDARAVKAGVACRYRDNGDGTISDLATGLMWERKIETSQGLPCALLGFVSCVTRTSQWVPAVADFISELNGFSSIPASQVGLAGHSDWRLPTAVELQGIVDTTVHNCTEGEPCIDPTFGPTAADRHWSSTATSTIGAWQIDFYDPAESFNSAKTNEHSARAVRNDL